MRSPPRTGRYSPLPARAAARPDLQLHPLRRAAKRRLPATSSSSASKTPSNEFASVTNWDADRGGVVWHTQGSGKSLTMVMLAKAIALEKLPDYKIVLVTDRVDLDDQIYKTFTHCDMEPHQARSGKRPGQATIRPKEPSHHDDHRQVRERGAQGQLAKRGRQHLRPGR